MGGGYDVGRGSLDNIRGNLHGAHGEIEGLAGSIPEAGDAGVLSGALMSLLAGFVDNAAQFSMGLHTAADEVRNSIDKYQGAEDSGRASLDAAGGAN